MICLLYCVGLCVKIYLGAIVATGGGFAFQMYEYILASSHFGGDAYEENIKERIASIVGYCRCHCLHNSCHGFIGAIGI